MTSSQSVSCWYRARRCGPGVALVMLWSAMSIAISAEAPMPTPGTSFDDCKGSAVCIAELGHDARDAAPALIALLSAPDLDGPDWDRRRQAARALGYIGEPAATDALVTALRDPSDVIVNWVAAESLGKLRARPARKALVDTASTHWHPAVRDAARRALQSLDDDSPINTRGAERHEFFMQLADEALECGDPDLVRITSSDIDKRDSRHQPDRLNELRYQTLPAEPEAFGEDVGSRFAGCTANAPAHAPRNRQNVMTTPQVALRIGTSWLAGTDRGEWGGELVWIRADGQATQLLAANVFDIVRLGPHVVAVTGLAHLGTNDGMLYIVAQDEHDNLQATPWRALPAAPKDAALTHDGQLMVNTYGGGAVLIDPTGRMTMAPCRSSPPP